MTVNLIAAVGRDGQVGSNGMLPWHRPEDLRFFRKVTMGGVVIVGRRTFSNLAALPGRDVYPFDGKIPPAEMLKSIRSFTTRAIWIAGGTYTWRAFAPHVDGVNILSCIDYDGPADTYFPFDAFNIRWSQTCSR